VGKGPDSLGALRWAMTDSRVRCVLGNHEARLLRAWREGRQPREKASDGETHRQLGDNFEECMRFVSRWPLFLEEDGFAVVHAGVDPVEPSLAGQHERDLLTIRTLADGETPWFEDYRGDKLLLFGHTARAEPLVRANVIGLDTGCVYGGLLSAVVLPERRLISVRARRAYREKKGWPVRDELRLG